MRATATRSRPLTLLATTATLLCAVFALAAAPARASTVITEQQKQDAILDWTTRDTRTNVANGSTITSTWTPATGRYVRIRMTASHGSGPPFSTQVRELQLFPS